MNRNTEERYWSKVDKSGGCWEWKSYKDGSGYAAFKTKGKMIGAHRQAWIYAHGEIPAGMLVCHKCDNPTCVNPDHLFLGTALDNQRDKVNKGRQAAGEKNGRHKLTEQDVKYIRSQFHTKQKTQRELARIYNMGYRNLWRVIHTEWRCVPNEG